MVDNITLCLLFLPSVAVELFFVLYAFLVQDMSMHLTAVKGKDPMEAVLFFIILIGGFLLYFPAGIIVLFNSLVACFAEMEALSWERALGRTCHMCIKVPILTVTTISLVALIALLVQIPLTLPIFILQLLLTLASGFIHNLLQCVTTIFQIASLSLITVFCVGIRVATAACIYNDLTMRLEGRDIIEHLSATE